jgi:hypothetical protein
VDVAPRLSGRSSPGGGSSLGETSWALGAPGGATSSSARGTASSPSSGFGITEAVPLALLLSSQMASTTTTAMARLPIPTPTALPLAPLPRPVLDGPNRRRTFPRASMACPTASLRLVLLLLRPKRSHMLLAHASPRLFHYRPLLARVSRGRSTRRWRAGGQRRARPRPDRIQTSSTPSLGSE